ncbi:MAG: single-stranded-DNA-specific exonuclease RecJ [Steroidobacterales bacterium]
MSATRIRRRPVPIADECLADLHPVLRRIYAARGVATLADLDQSLQALLPVSTLPGVAQGAQLLAAHRDSGRVLVIGDFDADGATSSALVVRALRSLKFVHVDFLVPDRFRFGYGLTPEIVALAATREPTLIVTVDNGVSSIEGVEAANARGIPVLVTDHHLPASRLPAAIAIINPNLPGSTFASGALAGVGVAFYLMVALAQHLQDDEFRAADLLDLVALGTVADMVPLDRNNRVLVAQGLRRIRAGRSVPGIRALLAQAGRRPEQLTAADLGFAVAPRLNAAGRLTDMSVGIACLLSDDATEADRLAASLSALNDERREIEQRMQSEAVDIAAASCSTGNGSEMPGLCLFDPSWHQGIVGLVAGRIKDRLHRPVVAFAPAADGSLRGSARSVAGIHIRDALDSIAVRHPGLLPKFGGHAMAAGLSLERANLEVFRAAFAAEIARRADPDNLRGWVLTDGELQRMELNLATALALRAGGPWGQGFPEPLFDGEFDLLDMRIVGEKHLKMRVRAATGCEPLDGIAFGFVGGGADDGRVGKGARVRLAYRLEVNEYNGMERVQLNCQHVEAV